MKIHSNIENILKICLTKGGLCRNQMEYIFATIVAISALLQIPLLLKKSYFIFISLLCVWMFFLNVCMCTIYLP